MNHPVVRSVRMLPLCTVPALQPRHYPPPVVIHGKETNYKLTYSTALMCDVQNILNVHHQTAFPGRNDPWEKYISLKTLRNGVSTVLLQSWSQERAKMCLSQFKSVLLGAFVFSDNVRSQIILAYKIICYNSIQTICYFHGNGLKGTVKPQETSILLIFLFQAALALPPTTKPSLQLMLQNRYSYFPCAVFFFYTVYNIFFQQNAPNRLINL